MRIAVIGVGYVGLVTANCIAKLGNFVVGIDSDVEKIKKLKKGIITIFEPGLNELLKENIKNRKISFTDSISEGIKDTDIVFICVGTPPKQNGDADLSSVENCSREISENMGEYKLIVGKSTVPVNTGEWIKRTVKLYNKKNIEFDVASNPEFLREGTAIADFLCPDRIVIGVETEKAKQILLALYKKINVPKLVTNIQTAELIKHASNSFLAMKISYINALANICEKTGADIVKIAEGMGLDKRIGKSFLNAGPGYGGFCFSGDEVIFVVNNEGIHVRKFEDTFKIYANSSNDIFAVPEDLRILSFDFDGLEPVIIPVKVITRRKYNGELVTIRTKMGRNITLTPGHPVYISDGEEIIKLKESHEIKCGDKFLTITNLVKNKNKDTINLLEYLENEIITPKIKVKSADKYFSNYYDKFKHSIPTTLMKSKTEVKKTNGMKLNEYIFLKRGNCFPDFNEKKLLLYTSKGSTTYIPAHFEVDEDFIRLIGYYLSEGMITYDYGRNDSRRERVVICFGEHEDEYIEDTKYILNSYNIKFHTLQINGSYRIIMSSPVLAFLLRDILKCGSNSYDKKLPAFVFNMPEKFIMVMLQGLYSGDGSIETVNKGRNFCYSYATVSKELANGILLLLQSIGIIPSFEQKMMHKSTTPAYFVNINGVKQLNLLRNIFGKKKREKIDILLNNSQRTIAQSGFSKFKNYATVEVKSVEKKQFDGYVYSVETENGILVSSTGLIIHNCLPKDVGAFIYIAEKFGYDFELLKSVEKINEEQKKSIVKKIEEAVWILKGKTIGILGLSFKPNTDDIRFSPAIEIASELINHGAKIKAYDPVSMDKAKKELPQLICCKNTYEVCKNSNALVILTDWDEFKRLNLIKIKKLLKTPIFIDARNLYDKEDLNKLGFIYKGVGR